MSKFTNRADLLIAAGESIKMQEAAGCEPVCKYLGELMTMQRTYMSQDIDHYEFPLAVVEGKAVFAGDELYHSPLKDGRYYAFKVDKSHISADVITPLSECHWLPPKQKTVMVELLVEDAEIMSRRADAPDWDRVEEACRKALGEMK